MIRSTVPIVVGYTMSADQGQAPAGWQAFDRGSYGLAGSATTTVNFYAVAAHGATGATGYISLQNLTDSVGVATLAVQGPVPTEYTATGVVLPAARKIYEVRMSAGGPTGPISAGFIGLEVNVKF